MNLLQSFLEQLALKPASMMLSAGKICIGIKPMTPCMHVTAIGSATGGSIRRQIDKQGSKADCMLYVVVYTRKEKNDRPKTGNHRQDVSKAVSFSGLCCPSTCKSTCLNTPPWFVNQTGNAHKHAKAIASVHVRAFSNLKLLRPSFTHDGECAVAACHMQVTCKH